ncbi:MAG: hypothetical protein HYT97_01680 [Elusimicrobia bacterium]|nr:hypothetical protein [Elusimicrobiota bacterium]
MIHKLIAILFLAFLNAPELFAEKASYEARAGMISSGGFVLFYNSRGPLSYNTLSPGELPKESMDLGEVQCKSCQHAISIPFISSLIGQKSSSVSGALGDGSFKKALSNLLGQRPELRGIYDVKIDIQKVNILGIYRKLCTEVTARGFK